MSMTSSKLPKPGISRHLRGEIRRSFSVWGFAKVHTMTGMAKKEQEMMLYELFHGSMKYASHIDKILKGEPPYAGMYTASVVTQNGATQASSLVVNDQFASKESTKVVKAKVHITKAVLERAAFTNPALITGRALLDLGKSSMRTIRKLISILTPHLDDNMKPKKSGETMDDVWEKVLDEAYSLLNAKTSVVEDITPNSTQEEPEGITRPESWRPDGWMALHLFGPTAPPSSRLNLLTLGEPNENQEGGKKNRGRAANRAQQAKERRDEREVNVNGKRGISIGNQIGIASLILSRKQMERDQEEQKMMNNHLHANRLIDQLNQAIRVAELYQDESPSKIKAMDRVDRLQDELDKLNEQMAAGVVSPDKKEPAASEEMEGVDEVIELLSKKQKSAPPKARANATESTTVPSIAEPSIATQKPPSVVYCTPNKSSVLAAVPLQPTRENNQAAICDLVKSLLSANGLVPYSSITYHLGESFPGLDQDAALDNMVEDSIIFSFDHTPTGQPMEMSFGLVNDINYYATV